jgi:hypothetical protein
MPTTLWTVNGKLTGLAIFIEKGRIPKSSPAERLLCAPPAAAFLPKYSFLFILLANFCLLASVIAFFCKIVAGPNNHQAAPTFTQTLRENFHHKIGVSTCWKRQQKPSKSVEDSLTS